MQIEQAFLDKVEQKLNKQNAFKAALWVSLWCIPVLILWYWVFHSYGRAVPMLLLFSGVIIGVAIRFHGRGYSSLFSVLAFSTHLLLVSGAAVLGLLLGQGETIWAVILMGLYIAGAWSSAFIARLQIPFLEQRAYFQLAEKNRHASNKHWRNRWFVAIPTMLVLCGSTVFVTILGLYSFNEYSSFLQPYIAEQQAKESLEKRAIDVTPASLDKLTTANAMLHVYAYSTGELINANGYFVHSYPISDYKAATILKYLAERRDAPRAKFLLGLLTEKDNGQALIQEAADEGDIYAKIHLAAEFGCYDKPEIARDLLNRLLRTTKEVYARARIGRILSIGFGQFCSEKSYSPISVEFVL